MEAAVIFAQILYGLAAAFCLVYYLPCALYWGWYGRELTAVLLVGLGSAAALGATAYFGMTVILWTVFAIFLLGLCVFFYVESKILSEMLRPKCTQSLNWLLLPGYKPRKGKIPAVLVHRVSTAAAWLQANPDAKAILSGGVTDGAVSEAAVMAELLVQRGIEPQRLVREEKSTTTEENMRFCFTLTGGESIALVTNGFHLYRACGEARKAGFDRVCPVKAPNGPGWLLPYHIAREFMTVINDRLNGYL